MKKQQLLNSINPRYNDLRDPKYYLKLIDYTITGIIYIVTFGDFKKAKKFHDSINPIRKIREKLFEREKLMLEKETIEILNTYKTIGAYNFKGILIPLVEDNPAYQSTLISVYNDVFKVFCEYDDDYSWYIIDKLERKLPEGTYCYVGRDGEEITIESGYTVIDAGAWIGDFSAYASIKGAKVYAFEPAPNTIKYLKKTAEMNGNITICPFGLGREKTTLEFKVEQDNSGGSHFDFDGDLPSGDIQISITTLDSWANENAIEKIDFIKADIEGSERDMLLGATNVLKTHQPILSLCTYHLPDDRKVMKEIILKANPKYKILQRKKKMFAYVPGT